MKSFIVGFAFFGLAAAAQIASAAEPTAPSPQPPTVSANDPATNAPGPHIQFAVPVYDFGKVIAGEVVKAEFVFTNTGDARLEISGVYPSCGCTAAGTWTRQVEPGQTGTIPIQFNSGHFMGPVAKSATVASNDKKQPTVMLQIKGIVWKPIDVSPQTVVLTVVPDSPSNAPAVVRVVSGLEQPVVLSDPQSSNPSFSVEVKTNQPGKEYLLLIKPVPPFSQNAVQGKITAKTSCTNVPVIEVNAIANVQPALVVMPPQIMLPAVFPSNAIPFTVSIRNNSVNPLALSEPALNAAGVQVSLKEVAPGRQFTATLTFPPNFDAGTNANLEFTVKSSNPRYPVVKVPIRQAQRPVQRAAPPIRPAAPPVAATPGFPAPLPGAGGK